MLKLRFLEAFLYPVRRPRRFLDALLLLLYPQLLGGAILALGLGGLLGLGVLSHSARSEWVISTHATLVHWLTPLTYLALLAGTLICWSGASIFDGYWLRAVREASAGARHLPPTHGRWRFFLAGLPMQLLLVLALLPVFAVNALGMWGTSASWLAAYQTHSDTGARLWALLASGTGLATLALGFATAMLSGFLLGMAALRLAVQRTLCSALNPVGVVRDIRQGWVDFTLCFMLRFLPNLVFQAVVLLVLNLNVLLLPLLFLLALPFNLYLSLLSGSLLAQYQRAHLQERSPHITRLPRGCLVPLALLGGLGSLGLLLASCALSLMLCQLAPDLLPSQRGKPSIVSQVISSLVPPSPRPRRLKPSHHAPAGPSPYAEIDRYALATPSSEERDLTTLAAYLTRPAHNDREKARAIYRWVTDRIAYDAAAVADDNPTPHPDPSPESALRTRLVVCDGYSKLFQALAVRAGLTVEFVTGDTKGKEFAEEKPKRDVGHAWNAIQLEGRWFPLDATWGAGHISNNLFEKDFCEFYFLPPPEQILYTHFPDEQCWQCLDKPICRDDFKAAPMIHGSFFQQGLEVVKPPAASGDRPFQVILKGPADLHIQAQLGESESDHSTMVSRKGQLYTIDVSPTLTGNQVLHIFAASNEQDALEDVLDSHVEVKLISTPLPEVASVFQDQEAELVSPRQGTLFHGVTHFDINIPGASQAFVKTEDGQIPLIRTGEHFTADTPLPRGQATVFALFGDEQYYYEGLAKYNVR